MSQSQSRAPAGNWIENRTLVRHTPDAVVLINGYEEFATCPSCNRTINLQKYITTISADASVEMSASANFSVVIPQWELSRFMRDGVPILQPALEVVIFMRGYYPLRGFAALGQATAGFDPDQVPLYPYYQVFRGVVTNVTHGYSGGFYTASVQCSNFLHFWSTQYISTNGSVFGSRPKGSMVEPSLIGSKLTGKGPYEIIYTLVKATFGAAYGVEFKFSKTSNVTAEDDTDNKNLYTHAAEWWAKNFSKNQGNLRMYGADGALFNAAQQAFLGAWSSVSGNRFSKITKRVYTALKVDNVKTPLTSAQVLKTLRANLFNEISTVQAIASSEEGEISAVDVLRMQAFILDIGKMGQVNLFESEYMTKAQIAQEVLTITGYEFYQDVDGDLVFKPPMYNMDTSSDPVYVIEDRDLISIDETETEPEATMVKATGSHFANLGGHGVDGWMGVGAVFIDYRLVAKFGYKEETFESNFLSSRHALYISCVNRLDLANVGVKSATVNIPLRPEMRAGYPIYIRSLDCFYYAKSISHSFSFNGQCTSTISCVAKRAKWFPPMAAGSGNGELPALSQVRLDAPGEFPQRPLMAYPQYLDGSNSEGPPQSVGFPNVVLALDATKVNIDSIDIPRSILTPEAYIEVALTKGILQRGTTQNEFILSAGNFRGETVTLSDIQDSYASVDAALAAGTITPDVSTAFGKILSEVEKVYDSVDSDEVKKLVNYLALQTSLKSYYAPGTDILGRYRYYSSSHPDAEHQAPENLVIADDPPLFEKDVPSPPQTGGSTPTLEDVGGGRGVRITDKSPVRGIRVANITNLGEDKTNAPKTLTVATSDIRHVTSGPQYRNKFDIVSTVKESFTEGVNFRFAEKNTTQAFSRLLAGSALPKETSLTLRERFSEEYARLMAAIDSFAANCGVSGEAQVARSKDVASRELEKSEYQRTSAKDSPRKDDASTIETKAGSLAKALWRYLLNVQNTTLKSRELNVEEEIRDQPVLSESYVPLMGFRAKFIREYTKSEEVVPDSAPATIYDQASLEQTTKISWTPIFPVSDGAGYEVFGNLPYGRGVTVEKYAELLGTTREVPSGTADPAQRAAEGKTNLSNYGINASSMEAIEQLLIAYTVSNPKGGEAKTGAAQILQNSALFSEGDRASVLAGLNTDITGVDAVVESLLKGETSEGAFIRNHPVTSFSRGQSLTSEAAAQNLARLTFGESSCSCQGSDSLFLVAALSEEFVGLYGEDPLVPWTQEQVYLPQAATGEYTKRVLAGEYLDTRNSSLAEEFASQGSLGDIYSDQAQNLSSQVSALAAGIPDEEV